MSKKERMFDPNSVTTIFKVEQPELYQRAMDARANGDGTLMHEGRVWQVGEGWGAGGERDSYVEIRPEWDLGQNEARPVSPTSGITVVRQDH